MTMYATGFKEIEYLMTKDGEKVMVETPLMKTYYSDSFRHFEVTLCVSPKNFKKLIKDE